MADSKQVLAAEGLSYSYDPKRTVLSDVTMSVNRGEAFVILGANGAGKSTLLNCLGGMLTPQSGDIEILGRPLASYADNELAQVLGYVPQVSNPTFEYTVRDYVVMGRAPHMGFLDVPGEEEYAKADEAMARMGIAHLAGKFCNGISGGERQQAQIARVLAQEAQVVLLDEPTNHLDYGNQLRIVRVVDQLRSEGLSVVMTSHNPDHAILLDGTVGILGRDGKMVSGPAREIVTKEALTELYGIDVSLVYVEELGRTACLSGSLR